MPAIPMPGAEVPVIDLNNTVGAIEIGILLSTFLFGIVSCQMWVYYRRFPADVLPLKLLVATVWLLELGHTVAVSHALYTITILDLDNPLKFIAAPKGLDVGVLCSAFVGPLCQAWFAYRVRKLSGKYYIPVFCWFLSFLRCVATVALGVEALRAPSLIGFEVQFKWLLTFILSVGAGVDVIIALSLCIYLRQHRATSFKRTVKMINQMMIYTVETGLLTSVSAVAMLICFLVMQRNFVWIAIFTFLAKLFSNSLMVALNARTASNDHETAQEGSTFLDIYPAMHRSAATSASVSRDRKSLVSPPYPNIAIEMSRTTEVKRDEQAHDEWRAI